MTKLDVILKEHYKDLDPRIQSFGDEIHNMAVNLDLYTKNIFSKVAKLYLTPFGKFDKMCIGAINEKLFPPQDRLVAAGQLAFKYGLFSSVIWNTVELIEKVSNYLK